MTLKETMAEFLLAHTSLAVIKNTNSGGAPKHLHHARKYCFSSGHSLLTESSGQEAEGLVPEVKNSSDFLSRKPE